jgi:hypothetical protein
MKTGFVVSGNLRLFTISTRPHVPYRFDFVIDDFEVDVVARHSLKLSWFLGSGARLQFALHCGPDSHSGIKQNPWTGYLLSGWLTL